MNADDQSEPGPSPTKTADRQQVFEVLNGERAYQDKKWPDEPNLPPSSALRLIRTIAGLADGDWYVAQDAIVNGQRVCETDLHALRKIAAVCIRCMEDFGCPPRRVTAAHPIT